MSEVVIQRGGTGDILDYYMDQSNQTTNYGSATTVRLYLNTGIDVMRIVLQPQIQSVSELKGKRITNAKLELYTVSSGSHVNGVIRMYQVLKNTDESQATWLIAKTGVNWLANGCASGTTTQVETTTSGQDDRYDNLSDKIADKSYIPPLFGDTWSTIINDDAFFTEYLNELKDGLWSEDRGILLSPVSGDSLVAVFRSSDHATAATRPKITITYRDKRSYFVGDGLGR